MADTFEKLSGSTDGKGIKVTGTSSAADVTVHTAVASPDLDLVTLWAVNQHTVDVDLTIAWGAETSPDNLITVKIPYKQGPVPITDRMPATNAIVIGAWASVADVVMIYGLVTRIDK